MSDPRTPTTTDPRSPLGRRRLMQWLALGAVAGVTGCAAGPGGSTSELPPPTTAPSGAATPSAAATPSPTITGPRPLPSREAIDVVGLEIAAIGLRADRLEHLALQADGILAAPKNPDLAGWYADGPVPGETGPAVIAGHIDSKQGPAVFARLVDLARGDEVVVARSDGRRITFRVDRTIRVGKETFPTDEVYGPVPDAQLRLITCDGPYVRDAGGYQDNAVVFATAVTGSTT